MKTKKPTSPIKASTQEFVEFETIKDDVVVLKDYSCCMVIKSGAVNFDLLSEEEQRLMITSFASLLNSLSFPVQILVLSTKMDISSYEAYLDRKINDQSDSAIKQQLVNYKEFVKNIVKKTTTLEKNFYFVIPFSPLEMGVKGATKKYDTEYIVARAKTSLYPKKDHLMRLLNKMGLKGMVLQEQQLVELMYALYNPSPSGVGLGLFKNYTGIVHTA